MWQSLSGTGGLSVTEFNPYAAPLVGGHEPIAALVESDQSECERIRRYHISHEASIRTVGILYYLGTVVLLIGAVIDFVRLSRGEIREPLVRSTFTIAVVYVVVGTVQFVAGRGLRKLRPWGQTLAGLLAIIGLLGVPIGTIVSIYILYLLYSQKGKTIFSEPYKAVIAATPHVRHKTSVWVWVLLGLVLGLLTVIIGLAVFIG